MVGYAAAGDVVPAPGGAYVEAAAGSPLHFNPLLARPGSVDDDVVALVFEGLTRIGPDGTAQPSLATDWQRSTDGREYTFRLRPGVAWHDGRPLVPDDVVATVNAIQAQDFPGDPALAAMWRDVRVEASGSAIRFALPAGNPWFPEQASLGLLPAHVLSGVTGAAFLTHESNARPTGTGPYRVVGADARRVTLASNDSYRERAPYLDTLELRFYDTPQAAVAAATSRQVSALRPSDEAVGAPAGWTSREIAETGKTVTLLFNTRAAPFDRAEVRLALASRLDTTRIAGTGRGFAVPRGGNAAPGALPPGLQVTVATNDVPAHSAAAEEVARQLTAAGLRAEVRSSPWASLVSDVLAPGRFQLALVEQLDWAADPGPFWRTAAALNFGGWSNPRADALLASRSVPEFWALFETEAPGVRLYNPRLNYLVSNEIRGQSRERIISPRDRFRGVLDWHVFTRRAPGRF